LLKVAKEKPDLLILDLTLPDVGGFKVIERLADPKFPPLPVIMLTARSDEASIQRCNDQGIPYAFKDDEAWGELEKKIQQALLEKAEKPPPAPESEAVETRRSPRILLVDDDSIARKWLTKALQKYDVEIAEAPNGMEGFLLALRMRPDLVVTDYNMEEGSGNYLLGRIKSMPSLQRIPVIIFTAQSVDERQVLALSRDLRGRGQAAAFVSKMNPSALIEEIKRFIPLHGKA
jgi:CheY-like chemotaxis protein